MIVLDTNVISELMRDRPEAAVVAWLDAQPRSSCWMTTICEYELRQGIQNLAQGKKRSDLEARLTLMIDRVLEARVLVFDSAAAMASASIHVQTRRIGRPMDTRDLFIAGIVVAHRATLLTRNTADFQHAGITLLNPWQPPILG